MSDNLSNELLSYSKGKLNRIKKGMDKEIEKRLDNLGAITAQKLREFTARWYNSYNPISYIRTKDLINCITYSIHKNVVYVYFDYEQMSSYETDGWNVHADFNGVEFTRGLIDWIENDANSGSDMNPRKKHNGVHMIRNTQEWLRGYLDKETQRIINIVVAEYSE